MSEPPPASMSAEASTPAVSSTAPTEASPSSSHSGFSASPAPAPDLDAELDGLDLRESESGMPLAELLETYWDSRVDLLDRKWRGFSAEVKSAARARKDQLVRGMQDRVSVATGRVAPPLKRAGRQARSRAQKAASVARQAEIRALHMDASRVRAKVAERVEKLQRQWRDAKVVRIRDALSFVVGVENLVVTSLVFALRPHWIPALYTLQCCFLLPLRFYTYSRQQWHYYLADFCYMANALVLLFLWMLPGSPFLLSVCFCCAYGPLGHSVVVWRNSMVFHSAEKLTSLFIHIYPLLVMHTIRHVIPRELALERYPALQELPGPGEPLPVGRSLFFSVLVYGVWQALYWTFISRPKKGKIQAGERANSFITMVRGKSAPFAPILGPLRYDRAEHWFMIIQFCYTMVTALPAPRLYFRSKRAASVFVFFVQLMAAWNGASYYVEVWGRRFEKELMALRAEVEAARQAEVAFNDIFDSEIDSAPPTDSEATDHERATTSSHSVSRTTPAPSPETSDAKDPAPGPEGTPPSTADSLDAKLEKDANTILQAEAEVDAAEALVDAPPAST